VEVSDDGGLKLVGKDYLAVMIDGRILQGDDLKQRLRSIRSDNIASIEVITSPPAKYSALGNSGLINIVLKKNPLLGWSGATSSAFRQRTKSAFEENASINFKSQKIEFFLSSGGFIDKKTYQTTSLYNFSDNYRMGDFSRKAKSENLSVSSSLSYKINEKSHLGVIADLTLQKDRENGLGLTNYTQFNALNPDSAIATPSNVDSKYDFNSVMAYYDYLIDSLGKKVTVNANYFDKTLINTRDISSQIMSSNSRVVDINNDGNTHYNGYGFNIDLELPYKFAKIETGTSLSYINNNAITSRSQFRNSLPINTQQDNFIYKESGAALYVSAEKQLSKRWSGKIGLRYEHTSLNEHSISLNQRNAPDYNNLFPSAYLSFNPNDKNAYTISYTRRTIRPVFNLLNPFRTYLDTYSYLTGNPFLLPSFSHNLELSHTYHGNLSTTLAASKLTHGVDRVTTFEQDSTIILSTPENYVSQYRLSLDISYALPLRWMNSFNSFSTTYTKSESYNPLFPVADVDGYGYYISTKNTVTINKAKSAFLVVNYFFLFPSRDGFYQINSRSSLDLGVRLRCFHNNLQISILGGDVLKKNINDTRRRYAGFVEQNILYNDTRNLSVTLAYTFGNKKVNNLRKYINNPNKNRAVQ
jgi:hypothetical protein